MIPPAPRNPLRASRAIVTKSGQLSRELSRAFVTDCQMIQSMTGYAAASADSPRGRLSLELRSVNSRFLDLQFRIAEELRSLEPPLRELIVARVARGKVDCRLDLNESGNAGAPRALNPHAV